MQREMTFHCDECGVAVCRYWLADTYEARHAAGEEPQNIDKEFLRLWFRENCDPYNDTVIALLLESDIVFDCRADLLRALRTQSANKRQRRK